MGGMNLAVRNVTGKDPDAYLSDYRNRNNMKMQELKEAVGVESRTTILNPVYIKEKMKGGASSASEFAEVITNTYGWNVMKTAAIDKELWDNIYNVYVKDELNLGVKSLVHFFFFHHYSFVISACFCFTDFGDILFVLCGCWRICFRSNIIA